jgi:hypothetical protein
MVILNSLLQDTNSRPSLSEARYLPNQIDMQDILQSVGQFPTSEDVVRSDHVEFNVIRYGTNCIIKSKQVCNMLISSILVSSHTCDTRVGI